MITLQSKFDNIMTGFVTQRNRLMGLAKQVEEAIADKTKELEEAETLVAALEGLDKRVDNMINCLTTIIGGESDGTK